MVPIGLFFSRIGSDLFSYFYNQGCMPVLQIILETIFLLRNCPLGNNFNENYKIFRVPETHLNIHYNIMLGIVGNYCIKYKDKLYIMNYNITGISA